MAPRLAYRQRMVLAAIWNEALAWVALVVLVVLGVLTLAYFAAGLSVLLSPIYFVPRWIGRVLRIVRQVGSDFDESGYRFSVDDFGRRRYRAGWNGEVHSLVVHTPRWGIGRTICAYADSEGGVCYCTRDGTQVHRLPRGLRKEPLRAERLRANGAEETLPEEVVTQGDGWALLPRDSAI
jgi:hypothetical protein